jgi:transmembrane sensor
MVREVTSEARLTAMSPDEAAAFWTTRHAEGLAGYEEEQFRTWLATSSENEEAWAEAETAWRAFDEAGDDEILAAMRSRALAAQRSSWFRPQLAAAAAVLLLLLASAWLMVPNFIRDAAPEMNGSAAPPLVYASAKGEVKVITLPDGSRVTLDSASSVQARLTEASRALRLLRGRAFFEVSSNPRRPFSVAVQDREVLALGTRFDVRIRPGELTVTLVEGSVKISAPGLTGSRILKPGQQFVERRGTAIVRSAKAPLEEVLGWQQGYVTFDNDTLEAAVAEINRNSVQQLVVRNRGVAALRVTGRFRSGDAERFGRVVGEIHPVGMVRRGPELLELVPRS